MATELVTQVEQLAVVDGVKLDSVSNILVGEHVAKLPFARARGRLYVLVEPLGDRTGWGTLSRDIAQAVHDEYYGGNGSVTSGLRRALERANQTLCEMNGAESRRAPRLAGLTAVVLKGSDLFIAQTGPALVYVVHGDACTRFPEDSPWLDMSPRQAMEEGYAAPLGLRQDLSVDLFHCQVEPGDAIVLAESSVAEYVDEREAATLFSREDDAAAGTRLQSLFRDKDISMLVVRAGTQGAQEAHTLGRLTPLAGRPPARATLSAEDAIGEPVEGGGARETLRQLGGLVTYCASNGMEAAKTVWRRMLPGSDRSRIARQGRRRVSGLSLASMEPRRLADDRLVLVGMLAGIAVLALVVYGTVRWQAGRIANSSYQRTVQSAEVKLSDARSATDPGAARQALAEADVLLTRALASGREDQHADELARQLGEQLDALDSVTRLYWLPVLREYADSGSEPSRVIAHGIDIYVLDRGLGRVHKYLFNPLMDGLQDLGADVPDILLRSGDVRSDMTVGNLLDMAWMPSGPGREWASLLVLEESGALLEYEPSSGIKTLAAGPRAGQKTSVIAGIEGRLLALDQKANGISVFEPSSGGYDAEGTPYTNAELLLSGVVDMAVDGDVYLLYADGLVAKLRAGEQIPFELSGLATRMKNPTAMCVTPAVGENPGYIYIADSGNQRVVQFSKDGQFIRQFQPKRGDETFANLTGLYVDEGSGKMVLLANNRLLLANLPRE